MSLYSGMLTEGQTGCVWRGEGGQSGFIVNCQRAENSMSVASQLLESVVTSRCNIAVTRQVQYCHYQM